MLDEFATNSSRKPFIPLKPSTLGACLFLLLIAPACMEFPSEAEVAHVRRSPPRLRCDLTKSSIPAELEQAIGSVVEIRGQVSQRVNKGGQGTITLGKLRVLKDAQGELEADGSAAIVVAVAKSERAALSTVQVGEVVSARGILRQSTVYRFGLDAAFISR